MYNIHVHVQYTCTIYMYMYNIHVHVQYTCTIYMYMYNIHVHVENVLIKENGKCLD